MLYLCSVKQIDTQHSRINCYYGCKGNELGNILSDKMRIASSISKLHGIFRIPQIVHGLGMEKEKGVPCSVLILFLGLFRLCGETMFRGCCCGLISLLGGESCCKNCFYRMLNDCTMDWRGFLYAVCKSFLRIAAGEGVQADGKPRCLIVDDTVLEKTGAHNRMEHISRVYDHGRHIHVLGFKLQLVVYFDGVTPIPVDFSIHCEWGKKKDCGMTKKDREARFTKDRAEGTSGRERSDEALQEKPRIFMKMLAKLWRRGLRPQYVLYDSWYHSLGLLKAIRSLGKGAVHALGMDKNGVRTYLVKGRKYTMMANRKRFGEYETMGEVFRSLRGELYALTLWQRLIPLMADILCRVAQAIGIDVEEAMRALESDEKGMDDIVCMAEALKAKDAGTQ